MNKINYYLRKNPLTTSEENKFMANISQKDTQWQEGVIEHMMKRNTTISKQDIVIVLDLMKETVIDLISNGYPVITDLFKARLSLKGAFTSFDDDFDSSRHSLNLNLNASKALKDEVMNNTSIEKTEARIKEADISRLYDYETRSFGLAFTAGGLMGLHGKNLIKDGVDPELFLKRDGEDETIPMGKIMDISERQIMCYIPEDLEAGTYKIGFKRDVGENKKEEISYGELVMIT